MLDKSLVDEGEEDNGHVTGLLAGQINENWNIVLLLLSNQLSSSVCGMARTDDDDVDCKISFRVSFLTICFRTYKPDCGVCCAFRQSQALFNLMRNTQKINAKSYLEEKRHFFRKFKAI